MSSQQEEFDIGPELDRAVRATVTGLAQLMERLARRDQERSREAAARAREEWQAQRDASRQKYLPWTAEGRLEKLDGYRASQKWAAAAAWSDMDPIARSAEQDMAQRIGETFGEHPSILLERTDPRTLPPDPTPPARLLSMNEAYGLAATHAPSWYRLPAGVGPLEQDRPPLDGVEQRFHSDWQHYSETGQLPIRSQWEQWAEHVGRGEEFDPEKWQTPDGTIDDEARDTALEAVWVEGREDRVTGDIADHEEAMHAAEMGGLAPHVGHPDEGTQSRPWQGYLTPARFDAAKSEDVVRAWRDASAAALTGDRDAQQSADKIATMMRDRRGLNPERMLIEALSEQAAVNTEARRTAEDRLRKNTEASTVPTATPAPTATVSSHTAHSATAEIGRDRVIELNDMAADFYGNNLRPGTPGHRYLTDRLGPEVETTGWQLGYAKPGWQNLTKHLRENGVSDAEMVAAGLAEPGKFGVRDVFRDRAMVGVRDHSTGETVGFVGRDLSGDPRAPKVRNTGETAAFRKGDHVLGLHEAQPGARLVSVEGPFDAMATSLASEGKAAGVTTMGTQMTNTQAEAITAKANGRVWLANDNDDAGQKATEEQFFKLAERGTDVRQIDIPGSDPAEAWQERPALLRASLAELEGNRSAAETIVDRYLAAPDATRRGFDDLMNRVAPYVDPLDRDLLAQRVDELDKASGVRTTAEGREAAARGVRAQTEEDLSRVRDTGAGDQTAADADVDEAARGHSGDQLEDEAAAAERALDAAQETTDEARAEEHTAYDRRDEARAGLDAPQAAARDGSSHGFSRPTQDQVTAPGRKSTPAKTRRESGVKQSRGRTLRR